ncbi:MAG TPA: hypothetical protein VNQ73_00615 [Ilumatobacter sp.]|nr:hypothetical protein [Ilumatobacter sp.]
MTEGTAPTRSGRATLLGRLNHERDGTLTLADGRLSFATDEVVFDVPVAELHSVAASSEGFHVWHQSTRYRFRLGPGGARVDPNHGNVGQFLDHLEAFGRQRQSKRGRADWAAELESLVGRHHPASPYGRRGAR